MANLIDFCQSGNEFQEILDAATEKAKPGFEGEFVDEMVERFEKYGLEMFLSHKQWNILKEIADRAGE